MGKKIPIGIILLILIGGALLFSGKFQFQSYQGCTVKETGGMSLVPQYGYYSCEPSDPSAKTSFGFISGYTVASCPPNTEECKVYAKNINDWAYEDIGYRICTGTGCTGWSWPTISLGNTFLLGRITPYQTMQVQLRPLVSDTSYQVFEEHIQYGLYQYELGSKELIKIYDCKIPLTSDLCINCKPKEPGETIYNNPVEVLDFNGYSTYLKTWVLSPIEASMVTDLDGNQVFCSNRKVYTITTITLESGCYAYADQFKRDVNCCPGDVLAGQTCNDKFEWTSEDIGCIKGGIPSILNCNGQGGWIKDYTQEKTIKRAVQCSSEGICVYEYMQVECASSADCPTGAVCDIGGTWKCIGGIKPCGDANKDCYDDCTYEQIPGCTPDKPCTGEGGHVGGIAGIGKTPCCEGLVEDPQGYCRKGYIPPEWLLFIILPLLGALIMYSKKRDVVKGVLGGVIGLIGAFAIQFILHNWLILLIGGIVGGAIMVYFFGGTILLIIMYIISKKIG